MYAEPLSFYASIIIIRQPVCCGRSAQNFNMVFVGLFSNGAGKKAFTHFKMYAPCLNGGNNLAAAPMDLTI
jgi:hypothetical protein